MDQERVREICATVSSNAHLYNLVREIYKLERELMGGTEIPGGGVKIRVSEAANRLESQHWVAPAQKYDMMLNDLARSIVKPEEDVGDLRAELSYYIAPILREIEGHEPFSQVAGGGQPAARNSPEVSEQDMFFRYIRQVRGEGQPPMREAPIWFKTLIVVPLLLWLVAHWLGMM